jgi:antirestriction protein ArdC
MPNSRMANTGKTSLQWRSCGIIRIAALCVLCRYRHKTHWTRHERRLNREFARKRFGQEGYVMEELVAELGSAFLSADLELTPEVREDHAS